MARSLLLIDDDPLIARHLTRTLERTREFDVTSVATLEAGLCLLASRPVDCVLLDYRLPDSEGLSGLRVIRRRQPEVPVIMVTGAGSEEVAVEAMKLGAADYVVKHGRFLDGVTTTVRDAIGRRTLRSVERACDSPAESPVPPERYRVFASTGIIGRSAALTNAMDLADRAARSDITVLLQGETGTGKELFARAIHLVGARAGKPFVPVNCAAVPEPLLESELFGHVRGAFSGADRDHRGLFEEAHRGTLFLDEVSELAPLLQSKLLRVLQDKEVRPVGSVRGRHVDVRIIAAGADLDARMIGGRFRRDLYHRLHVFPLTLPPLRDRRDDVALLAAHFVRRFAASEGKSPIELRPATLQALQAYDWPGNVRELENTMHRLVVCAQVGEHLDVDRLPAEIGGPKERSVGPQALKEIVREVEVATINARLREHGYRRAATAESLGITREGLWQKLRQLGVQLPRRGDPTSGS